MKPPLPPRRPPPPPFLPPRYSNNNTSTSKFRSYYNNRSNNNSMLKCRLYMIRLFMSCCGIFIIMLCFILMVQIIYLLLIKIIIAKKHPSSLLATKIIEQQLPPLSITDYQFSLLDEGQIDFGSFASTGNSNSNSNNNSHTIEKIKSLLHVYNPRLRTFGTSTRYQRSFNVSSSKYQLIFPIWFIPPLIHPSHVDRHTESVYLSLHHPLTKSLLCPTQHDYWLWIEDDVDLCPNNNSESLLMDIVSLFKQKLPLTSSLIYVRLSFGFNGILVRCAKHDEFIQAIAKHRFKPGIDELVGSELRGKSATYKWNLFQHTKSKQQSHVQVHNSEQNELRDRMLPQCLEWSLNTMILEDSFDSRCAGISLFSPCSRVNFKGKTELQLDDFSDPQGAAIVASLQLKSGLDRFTLVVNDIHGSNKLPRWKLIVGREPNLACSQICMEHGTFCEEKGLQALNSDLFANMVIPPDAVDHRGSRICDSVAWGNWDHDIHPIRYWQDADSKSWICLFNRFAKTSCSSWSDDRHGFRICACLR
jgi:hypothetical protein